MTKIFGPRVVILVLSDFEENEPIKAGNYISISNTNMSYFVTQCNDWL